jgi:hypothetical protein
VDADGTYSFSRVAAVQLEGYVGIHLSLSGHPSKKTEIELLIEYGDGSLADAATHSPGQWDKPDPHSNFRPGIWHLADQRGRRFFFQYLRVRREKQKSALSRRFSFTFRDSAGIIHIHQERLTVRLLQSSISRG